MHFSSRVLFIYLFLFFIYFYFFNFLIFFFLIDSCKALLIIYYVKRRYIKWKLLLLLLWAIVRISSLLTGRVLICLSRTSLLLRLRNLYGHVYLACVKIKRNGNTCLFAEHICR